MSETSILETIKGSGRFGLSVISNMIGTILLFAMVNITIFIYSLYNGFETHKIVYTLIVVLIGFVFTITAGYKMYRFLLIRGFSGIYEHLAPFFKKVSDFVIDKGEDLLTGKTNLKNKKNSKSIDVKRMLSEQYDKVPGVLKFGMTLIINRIPFVEMLTELKEEMDEENQSNSSEQLYNKMDSYITSDVFEKNNRKWLFWLLVLNIAVQLGFIYLK